MKSGVLAITGDARQRVESSKWWQKGTDKSGWKEVVKPKPREKESIMSYIMAYPSIKGSLSVYLSKHLSSITTCTLHFHLPPLSPHPGVFTSPLVTESIHTSGWIARHNSISFGLDVNVREKPTETRCKTRWCEEGMFVWETSRVFTHLGTLGGARLGREGTVGGGPP